MVLVDTEYSRMQVNVSIRQKYKTNNDQWKAEKKRRKWTGIRLVN